MINSIIATLLPVSEINTHQKHERKIMTCEMRCLRKAVNKMSRGRIRNDDIRDTWEQCRVWSL